MPYLIDVVPEWFMDEEESLRQAAEIGARHGYGNVVAHLLREWQLHLMRGGLSKAAARAAVLNRTPYELDQHRPREKDQR